MNRLKISAFDFYLLSPAELYYALEDFKETHYRPAKNICEVMRLHGQIVYNNAFGRKKKDLVIDPKELWNFTWEDSKEIKVQSLDSMKDTVKSIASMYKNKKAVKRTIKTIRTRRRKP